MQRGIVVWVSVVVSMVSGCTAGGDSVDAGAEFRGHRIIHYRSWPEEISVPDTETLAALQVLAPNDAGGFDVWPLVAVDAGWFEVRGVPPGEVYLVGRGLREGGGTSTEVVVTTAREVSLDTYVAGRPPWREPESGLNATSATVSASGLAPQPSTVSLGLYAPGASFSANAQVIAPPMVASFSGLPTSVFTTGLPPGPGDLVYALQFAPVDLFPLRAGLPDGGQCTWATAVRGTSESNVVLTPDGGALAVAFGSSPSVQLTSVIGRAAWDRVLPDPSSGPIEPLLFSWTAQADPGDIVPSRSVPGILSSFRCFLGMPSGDLALDVTAADPFPADWLRTCTAYWAFERTFSVPGRVFDIRFITSFGVRKRSDACGLLSPELGAVRELTVDGADGAEGGLLQTLTPQLVWAAPSVGEPQGYRLSVEELHPRGSYTLTAVALYTAGTSVRIPLGLSSGRTYFFRLRAMTSPGRDFDREPFVATQTPELASSEVVSGPWTTP